MATLPVFAVLLISEINERGEEVRLAERDTLIFLRGFSEVQRSITASTRTLLRTVSELPEIKKEDPVASQRILATLLKANPIYTNVILTDRNGGVVAMGKGRDKGFNFADRKQFRDAMRTRKFAYGEFVIGKQSKKSIFPFAMPVLNRQGQPQGTLLIGVNLAQYGEQYDKTNLPKDTFFGMCDHLGTRLFRYPLLEGIGIGLPIKKKVFEAARSSSGAGLLRAQTSEGSERIVAFEPLRLTPDSEPYMYMFMGISEENVLASANSDLIQGTIVGVSSLCFALLMAWGMGWQTIAAKIDRLAQAARNLGRGDEAVSSGISYDDGEIGQLAESFDTMSVLLQKREDDLHSAKEIAESANSAKDEFLANISHEVRTPLNGVMGVLQLLQETKVDREQKTFLDTALHSSRNLLRVLNDLLDFIKVGAGKLQLVDESFDLDELVCQSTGLFQLQVAEKNIALSCHVDPPAKGRYLGDVGRIRQIFFNLLGNAIKFTQSGTIKIEVYTLPHPKEEYRRLFFSIEDSGVGIPDDKQAYVFDAFTQVDGSLSREYQGTGLGLPIVKKLVKLMNGNVVMESEVGVGTTVLFCVQVRPDESDRVALGSIENNAQAKPLNILLVEDETVNRLMASRLMGMMGHTVFEAINGRECLQILDQEAVDVIIMDIQMPIMDGLEATRVIRTSSEYARYATVPIIALSAHAADHSIDEALRAGVDAYLTKPFEKEELERALRKVAGSSS